MRSRIMYIEAKGEDLTGPARIGRVTFSKSGRTIYYGSKGFRSLKGDGFKANYYEVGSGEWYWISGPARTRCIGRTLARLSMKTRGKNTGRRSAGHPAKRN